MNVRLSLALTWVFLVGCHRSMDTAPPNPRWDTSLGPDMVLDGFESNDAATWSSRTEEEDLEQEAAEVNPQSETVLLKLSVSPPTKAVVMRGQKVMARLTPGAMNAEWAVPRNGGPLDLEIRADGYLPFHTRLYSDRDDKIAVRLYRAGDAVGLWGYRPPSDGK